MSFDNYYPRRKDRRKPYRKAKLFDRSCRNHGTCPYCKANRLWFDKKKRIVADEELAQYKRGNKMMTSDQILDLARPDSGCELAQTMPFTMFLGLCVHAENVCKDCAFNPCPRTKIVEERKRQARNANFGKPSHETNAELAKRLNVSSRQISKMRKKGEL